MTRLRLTAIAVAILAMGADTPTQTISGKGITFEAPKAWTSAKPSSPMRMAQLKAEPAEGDKDPAELVVTFFAGGGGGIEANLARWKAQFLDKEGNPAELVSEKRKGKNVDITFVQASGHYVAPIMPGRPEKYDKPNWTLLGAIVQSGDTGYFFKMVGPDKTMKALKPDFEAMLKTIASEQ